MYSCQAAWQRAEDPPWRPAAPLAGLRIRRVRPVLTAPEGIRLVVVKVETTEPDLHGLGCATFTQRPLAVATVVDRYLDPLLRGRSPGDVEDIWRCVHLSSYWRSGPVLNSALAGVDMACWDIKGRVAGMPLYELLGGRCRPAAAVYAHASGADAAEVEEAARGWLAEGCTHVRCQVDVPGSAAYGARPAAASFDQAAYRRLVPRLFDHLRGRLGDEVELLHDVHERLAPADSIGLARDLEPHRLFFLEDPLAPEDLGWLPRLRQQCAVPIAMGELFVGPAEYVPAVSGRLIDFVRPHLSAIGGITPARKLAALCEHFGVRTAWHGPGDVSPVGHAANLHLDLACPNFGIQEQHRFDERAREVFPGCPEVRDGRLWPNERPGLGVELDEVAAARFPFPDEALGGSWPPLRGRDGAVLPP
jgi:mannonate dehydratase